MNDHRRPRIRTRPIEAVLGECVEEQGFHAEATAGIHLGGFRLRVESRPAAHEIDRFLKGQNAFPGELRGEPGPGVQPLQLGDRKVRDVPHRTSLRVGGAAIGEDLPHVGGALQREVVKADEHAILRDLQVLLDEVRPLLDRQAVRRRRVLGRIRRGASMRDEDLAGLLCRGSAVRHGGNERNGRRHTGQEAPEAPAGILLRCHASSLNPCVAAISRRYVSSSSATRAADQPSSRPINAAAPAAAPHP